MVDNITARFNEIYASTSESTLSYIAAKCPNIDDMNDIFQETYMELFRVLTQKGADYVKNGEAFAIKLAKQKIYKHYSVFDRLKKNVSLTDVTVAEEKEIIEYNLNETDIDDVLCTEELTNSIERFLREKPQDVRKIFFLRFSMELSITEIAKLMGTKESVVKNKLYRTIREIRALYTEEGEAIERK